MKEYVTIEDIYDAYYDCRRHKRNKYSSLKYELNYEANNHSLWQDLNSMTYEIGCSLAFVVTRPKLREVFAADFRDRIVHHLIMLKFFPLFEGEMIDNSFNCRKGKGTSYGIKVLEQQIEKVSCNYTKEAWILRCDIQGFFMSIDKEILWRQVETLIREKYKDEDTEWWLWLIKKVIMHRPELFCRKRGNIALWDVLPENKSLFHSNGKGLPIGNLTSQIFANLYMTPFDKWLLSLIKEGEEYSRFVDDFVLVGNDGAHILELLNKSRTWLHHNLHLTLHPDKVYFQEAKKGVKFIGAVIKLQRRYTSNRTVENMFRKIHRWLKDKNADNEKFAMSINSYFGFLIHNNSYAIRYNAWKEIAKKGVMIMVGKMHHVKLKRK